MDNLCGTCVSSLRGISIRIALLITILSALTACVPVRPVAKIGLIAPFEGLYRRTGYEALAAMREALAECSIPGHDVLPVALDDSNLPDAATRAAEKLLADPAVTSVIGPISPQALKSTAQTLRMVAPHWYVPFMVNPDGGFVDPSDTDAWASPLIAAIATGASLQGSQRLLSVATDDSWLPAGDGSMNGQLPIPILTYATTAAMLADLQPVDAVLWLGAPDAGADLLNHMRTSQPDIPFWMGPQGADPVFTDRAMVIGPAYWAIWTDSAYNSWSDSHIPATPTAYLTYRATCTALARMAGQPISSADWRVQLFRIGSEGESEPLSVE